MSRRTPGTLDQVARRVVPYVLGLHDVGSGGFRFCRNRPATLMATCYAVLALELVGALHRLSAEHRKRIVQFLLRGEKEDGTFLDPLFSMDDVPGNTHDETYFVEETSSFCRQTLDALGVAPPRRRWGYDLRSPAATVPFLEGLHWKNPWAASNHVMFRLSELVLEDVLDPSGRDETVLDSALDWLDARVSPETGLWDNGDDTPLLDAMATSFHFVFFYDYRGRQFRYPERVIDSCLQLQAWHGLFCEGTLGHTCLDYDALDLLRRAALQVDYRMQDVQIAMDRAAMTLRSLQQPDGGFAHCGGYVRRAWQGRKARLLRRVGLRSLVRDYRVVPSEDPFTVCWNHLSCKATSSNVFSTWFRLLGLLAAGWEFGQRRVDPAAPPAFRRIPFLGYGYTGGCPG